ncbi:MAG: type II secretion system F family protein [Lachnospiraceae bacterium]|nr:type II secretion system F family protein [Lachnospiraceae bacterium]
MKFNGKRNGLLGVFDRIAAEVLLIFENLKSKIAFLNKKRNVIHDGKTEIIRNLSYLSPGENKESMYYGYLIKKLSLSLMVVFAGGLLAAGVDISGRPEKSFLTDGSIERDMVGGEIKEYELQARTEDGYIPIDVTVSPRKMSKKEVDEALPEFWDRLFEKALCENESKDAVSMKLNLVKSIPEYPFSIEWSSSDLEILSPISGEIGEINSPTEVILSAHFRYGGEQYDNDYPIKVVPGSLPDSEKEKRDFTKYIENLEKNTVEEDEFALPDSFNGKSIKWNYKKSESGLYILIAVFAIAFLIYKMSDKDLRDKLEEKRKVMKDAYPDIIQKYALYTKAGMTLRNAFFKIADSGDKKPNPIYSEMLYTCREIKSGKSEEDGYHEFGQRCGLSEYIRLSAILSQNIKRGSSNFQTRLREELDSARRESLQNLRKLAEEASTKLLLPMVMILMIVMVMILLPAFSGMNI